MNPSDYSLTLSILINLRDHATHAIQNLQGYVNGLGDTAQLTAKKVDNSFKNIGQSLMSVYMGWKSSLMGFSAMKNTFGSSIQGSVDFEYAMARVKAVSGATGEAFEELQKQSRDLGRETQFTAIQVANSQEMLSRAGFNYRETIAAMPGLLNMANAEGMELAQAADIASNTLRGFGLEANKMGYVADILAKTSSITNTSIASLGESFKYIAPDAHLLGIEIDDVAAMVGALGDVGIKSSQAGTELRMALSRLAAQPKQTQAAMEALGLSITDTSGNMLNFVEEIIPQLSAKLRGMGNVEKKAKLRNLFGTEASTGMAALLEAYDTGKLGERLEQIRKESAGASKNMADTMNDTVQGALGRMRSAFESLRITIGDTLKGAFRKLIDWITGLVTKIDAFMTAHPTLTKMIVRTAAVIMAVVSALLVVAGTMVAIKGLISIFGLFKKQALGALLGIVKGSGLAGASLGTILLKAANLAAIAALVYYAWQKNLFGIRKLLKVFSSALSMVFGANSEGITEVDAAVAEQLQAAGLWDYAVNLGKVFWRIRQFFEGFVEGIQIGFTKIGKIFSRLGDVFAPILHRFTDYTNALGLLEPIANSLSNIWRDWGKTIGELVPYIIAAIVAFKGFSIVKGIIGSIMGPIQSLFGLFATNPIIAALLLIGYVLMTCYFQFEGFRQHVIEIFNSLATIIGGVLDFILGIIQFFIGLVTGDFSKMKEGICNIFSGLAKFIEGTIGFIGKLINGIYDGILWIGEKLGLVEAKNEEVLASAAAAEGIAETQDKAEQFSGSLPSNAIANAPTVTEFAPTGVAPEMQEQMASYGRTSQSAPVSAPILAQRLQSQSIGQENALSNAINENSFNINNDTKVDVKIQPQVTKVDLDGVAIGEAVTKYQTAQNVRYGMSEVE